MRAVKLVLPNSVPDLEAFNAEARLLNEVEHPNIVSVYGTEIGPAEGESPDVGMYAIVMEYMKDGSLEDAITTGDLPLDEALHRFTETCRGTERVHACGYVHRDIKPANILLDGPQTKLSDFGLAQPLKHGFGSAAGTPYYVAPEVIESGITSHRSDVYSLAVTLYESINGRSYVSWRGSSDGFARAVTRGEFPVRSEYAPFVPAGLRRIIYKAMHVDPLKRFASVAEFRHALAKVPIKCSWRRERDKEELWIGIGVNGRFQVKVDVGSGSIELSRCKSATGTFRKVTDDCLYSSTTPELRQHQQVLMQRITSTGK